MDRTLLGILTAIGAALLLVGVTFSRSVDAPADFRFNNETEPQSLDPQLITGHPEHRLVAALFEGLARPDALTLKPAPGVAKSWDISPDGKRYTFHLRDDARWSDGHAVTADDFIYSWKRLLDPKVASQYAYLLFPVRYAEALNTAEAHAATLEKSIGPALVALAAEHPEGLGARDWNAFLSKNSVNDPLRGQTDAKLTELLARGRSDGAVSASDLAWMRETVGRVAIDQRRQAAEARAHFGVDGGMIAPDPHTLIIELRAPTPYFMGLVDFASTAPVPRWVVERHPDDWFLPEHIVSNGPFVLKRWLVNDHIRLERSETYWGKDEVKSKAIDALSNENVTTVLNMYLTHAIDWGPEGYPKELGRELRHRPDFVLSPTLAVYYYRINVTRPPFDDRRVRKALNLAVDRAPIVERILGLGQPIARTFVPPGIPGYEPPPTEIRFDPEAARALLAEAGHPDGKGIPEIGILYNTNEAHKIIAEYVADQLRRNLGIKANAYNQEWQSYLNTVRSLDYDVSRAAWVGDYMDPTTFLEMFITNGGNNQTGWSSALYDRLLRAAADVSTVVDAPDSIVPELRDQAGARSLIESVQHAAGAAERLDAMAKLRLRLLQEAEQILVRDEFPVMPVYFYVTANFVAPRVRGFYATLHFEDGTTAPNLQSIHPLRDLWVDDGRGTR